MPTLTSTNNTRYNNRILVVGGGGARGAWGAGFVKHLTTQYKGTYRTVFGTSTGSLMAPLIVLNKFDKLKEAYTTTTQKDVFNINPFNERTGKLKQANAAKRILAKKESLGESDNLLNLINTFLSDDDYKDLINATEKLQFVVAVVDFHTGEVVYKSSAEIPNAEKMKRWMWASANEPIFMSYFNDPDTVEDTAYVDGGVVENVPLQKALEYALQNNIRDIDVVVNKPFNPLVNMPFEKKPKILDGVNRLIDIFSKEIRKDDILIAQLKAEQQKNQPAPEDDQVCIHPHYFPAEWYKDLFQATLLFNPDRMKKLWEVGENNCEDPVPETDTKICVSKSYLNQLLQ